MFIKREDLVDMLEAIDCENGYVDLDHLVECCNNLPSSGMSVWCMKCENNGECMTIDKPNCFQPRQANTPQTERIKTLDYCDICNHKGCKNCIANNLDEYCVPSNYAPNDETPQTNDKDINVRSKDEPQTDCETCRYAGGCDWEPWQECPYTPKNEPQTDCAWR